MVLAGARLQMLSLVWLCGLLDLDVTAPQVGKIIRIAVEQRNKLYRDKDVVDTFKRNMLSHGSLYNRQILVSAMIGTREGTSQAPAALQRLGLSLRTSRLTHFDARSTCSDRTGFAPDFSKGEINISFPNSLTDDAFDAALVAEKFDQ